MTKFPNSVLADGFQYIGPSGKSGFDFSAYNSIAHGNSARIYAGGVEIVRAVKDTTNYLEFLTGLQWATDNTYDLGANGNVSMRPRNILAGGGVVVGSGTLVGAGLNNSLVNGVIVSGGHNSVSTVLGSSAGLLGWQSGIMAFSKASSYTNLVGWGSNPDTTTAVYFRQFLRGVGTSDFFKFDIDGTLQFLVASGAHLTWATDGAGDIGASGGTRPNHVYAKAGVHAGGSDASAIMSATSTTQGFLPPRMTNVQRAAIASPATGLQVFSTDDNSISYWDGTTWQEAAPLFSLASGAALSGTYKGSVYVDGDATVSGDLTVQGSLFVLGALTNSGGHAVTIKGDLTVEGAFNFTPTSTASPQSNVAIWGDFAFGQNSEFKVNKGQSPILKVGGDIRALVFDGNAIELTLDGTGQPEASGLTIEGSGNAYATSFQLSGGDSAGVSAGGNGGYLNIAGKLLCCDITANGGNSSHSGFDAGNGGSLACESADLNSSSNLNGGNATGVGNINGGAGGTAYINAQLVGFEGCSLNLNGGGASTGNGGTGGTFTCFGPTDLISLNVNGGDVGATGTCGNAGTIANTAPMRNCILSLAGGGSGAGSGNVNGGNGGTATIDGACNLLGLSLSGGRPSTVGNGGNAGSLTVNGDALIDAAQTGAFISPCGGGEGIGASSNGGNGGTVTVNGNLTWRSTGVNPMYFRGGSGGTGGVGGDGGSLVVAGSLSIIGASAPLNLCGGDVNVSGTAGNAGVLRCNGCFSAAEIDIQDGSTGTAPTGTGKGAFLSGPCHIGTMNVTNRTGVTISSNGAPTTLKVAALPGRQVLTNEAGTNTGSIAADLASSIFSYDPTTDTWYKHTGTAA